jgi:sigma-B regulation protein RsbU (phosphoserine phosphatase)
MGIFTLVLIVLMILRSLWLTDQTLSPTQAYSLNLLWFLFAVPALYYTWKLCALIRRRLLWKISRRLVLSHTLIGAIPVLLVVVILYISVLLLYYQFSYYLIENQIGMHAAQLYAYNLSLSEGLQQAPFRPRAVRSLLDQDAKYLLGAYPNAAVVIRITNPATGRVDIYATRGLDPDRVQEYQAPQWLQNEDFSGLVVEDAQPEVYATDAGAAAEATSRLYLRSIVFSETLAGVMYSIETSVPVDSYLLERFKAALGLDLILAEAVDISGLSILQDTTSLSENILSATFDQEEDQERQIWSILLYPVSWISGTEKDAAESDVLFVELSAAKLVQTVFSADSTGSQQVSQTILGVLQIVVVFFLTLELISLVIGILLTKSITNAVYNLDRGTAFVKRGDFSHRIVVKSKDQLGALANSFNQMTEYVQDLVKDRVRRERLERELEIAKEVQEQLFPRRAPQMNRLELAGLCLPARVVSGDYYDFLPFNVDEMGLALGDICGKGISAALLMANLQATLRSNVFSTDNKQEDMGKHEVAGVVSVLNHQICAFTSANKFATFFYALYNDRRTTLTYCNAGHNPPLYFDGDGFRRLSTGGTVVGIFPDAEFEQETIELHPGNILLAYTDGIVESVNEYGEEFGEERLVTLVQENRDLSADQIQKTIVSRVLDWAFEEERDDDMTLILAKFR